MASMMDNACLFSGTANPGLAALIATELETPLGSLEVSRFSDGEIRIEIKEHVRGRDIYIIQPTCYPPNDTIMELLIMADAFRRAAVHSITAVIPYFGYSRQDRKIGFSRVPISARLIADMIENVGIRQIVAVELHATQEQGFFSIPVVDASSLPIIAADIYKSFQNIDSVAIVAPDSGGVVRARALAKSVDNHNLVIIDKRRPEAGRAEVMNIVGDVEGKNCIIIDDMIDTAGTLCKSAEAIKANGAKNVFAYCTHPILSGDAYLNIMDSVLVEVVVTNSIPVTKTCTKIRQISIAGLLAETIRRIHTCESVSSMYLD